MGNEHTLWNMFKFWDLKSLLHHCLYSTVLCACWKLGICRHHLSHYLTFRYDPKYLVTKGLSHWLNTVISCWMSSISSSASSRSIILIATTSLVRLLMPLYTSPKEPFPIRSCLVKYSSGSRWVFWFGDNKVSTQSLSICHHDSAYISICVHEWVCLMPTHIHSTVATE